MELHIHQIAQQLIQLGHSVIVITHAYGRRSGVRILTNGLKVYYVPYYVVYRESTYPTVFCFFPIFRNIVIREQIDVVHGHGSMSSFCHEAITHGHTMGLATVFTDHSLFGFGDTSSILINKVLKYTLTDVNHVICVSHTCRENTALRAALDPRHISVIPNAVVSDDFLPDPSSADPNFITIVLCSRLYSNKGADLLPLIIPKICAANSKARFLIAGSGPKSVDLQQMREQNRLQNRVKLVGAIRHEEVRGLMVQGQIYLHPSLTDAFGTVIVEAACCGLLVVTTNVGGIPEVLPKHMTVSAEPSAASLVNATLRAIEMLESGRVKPYEYHDEVKKMYNWKDVAVRTEKVYLDALDHMKASSSSPHQLFERLQRHYQCGLFAGKLFVLCVVVDVILLHLLDWLFPRSKIDPAKKWPVHATESVDSV